MAKEIRVEDLVKNVTKKFNSKIGHRHHEINLVPDVKSEMIKALKLRNLIFFLCIIVAAASVGVTFFFGAIVGGQQLAIDGKQNSIKQLSTKLKSYSDLDDFLTIKDQLSNLRTTTDNKKVLSRAFNVLSTILPVNGDLITINRLDINLSGDAPIFALEAQADARRAPYIDYNVLDSFKKSLKYMHYDYGQYVDREGNTIPAYCMVEKNNDGSFLRNENKDLYAYWLIDGEGCNPSAEVNTDSEESSSNVSSHDGYTIEDYGGASAVRIWRTPQFDEWYKANPQDGEAQMTLDGTISNVPHFESSCITYSGEPSTSGTPKWTTSNICNLVPNDDNSMVISESSNGRDANNQLVLRFNASIILEPAVFNFNNTHMIALPPSGRYNVTDSYVQVQAMFGERAHDCAKDDAQCNGNGGN